MSFEYSRNIQDASLNPAAFALNNGAGSTNSASVDLGTDVNKPEAVEVELSVPALNTTMVPDTRTVVYLIESSTTLNFSAVDQTILTATATGAGGAGVGALLKRVRLPSNCARYLRGKVTMGGTTGDASSINATLSLRF